MGRDANRIHCSFPRVGALVLLLATLAFNGACSSREPRPDFDPDEVTIEVLHAVHALARADRTRDAQGVLSLLAPDFYMYGDGERIDRATAARQIQDSLPKLQSFETDFEEIQVTPLAPDAALVSMTFRDRITDAQGNVTHTRGPSTFVWRLREGRWQIAYLDADHYPGD